MTAPSDIRRTDLEAGEAASLAPYAMTAAASRGRDHAHQDDPWRTAFQRDHDRIIHSRAFRRLQYKTQVFPNDEGDLFRTRLTHTLEVVQLARSAGRRLGLNPDLIECVGLVHDLGHPPFGHRGEAMLAELMADHGGFEHNRQALRTVEELEVRYPDFPGLNLTYEVRESIVKHGSDRDPARIPQRFHASDAALLEAQLVDEVDSITYDCHDLDDGLRAGYIDPDAVQEVPLWQAAWREAAEASPRATAPKLIADRALRILLDAMLGDLIDTSRSLLAAKGITTLGDVRAAREPLIQPSPSMREAKQVLERWLFANLYRHWQVNRKFHLAQRIVADLFAFFTAHPDSLPPEHAQRAAGAGLHRAVADYIAGMTDRFAGDEHRRLCR